MCLTPDSEASSGDTQNGAAAATAAQSGVGSNAGNIAVNNRTNSNAENSSINTARGGASIPRTSSSAVSSIAVGGKKLTSTTTTASSLRLRGSNTSSLASKFGGNVPIFPKLGVGSSPIPLKSTSANNAIKKVSDIISNNNAIKAEFATVKLKKVSKFSDEKSVAKTSDGVTKLSETSKVYKTLDSSSVSKGAQGTIKQVSDSKSSELSSSSSLTSEGCRDLNVNQSTEALNKSNETIIRSKELSTNVDVTATASSIIAKSISSQVTTHTSSSSKDSKTISSTSSVSFSSSSSNSRTSSPVISNSSNNAATSTSFASNILSRSSTVKASDIPAVVEDVKGDTEIKVTTTVKKVKKSVDGVVKRKKKRVTKDGGDAIIIPVTIEEVTNEAQQTKKKETTTKKCSVDREIKITVLTKEDIANKKELEKPLINGIKGVSPVSDKIGVKTEPEITKKSDKPKCTETDGATTTASTVSSSSAAKIAFAETETYNDTIKISDGDSVSVLDSETSSEKQQRGSPTTMTKKEMAAASPGDILNAATVTVDESNDTTVHPSVAELSAQSTKLPPTVTELDSSLAFMTLNAVDISSSTASQQIQSDLTQTSAIDQNCPPCPPGSPSVAISIPPTTGAPSIPIPSSLSSSPSVCSLSTATDTLSTSISTSVSDLSISPPPSIPTCTTSIASSVASSSTTTLSNSTHIPLSSTTSTSSAATTTTSYLPSTLFTSENPVTIIVRDMSTVTNSMNRTTLYAPAMSTVGALLIEVGQKFGYEPDSFSLSLQNTKMTSEIELEKQNQNKTLVDVGFIVDGVSRNGLLLSDLHGYAPKRTADVSGNRDDDLALGASASPTSCGEDSGIYSSSSTATGSRKKQTWLDMDTSVGTAATASSSIGETSSEHEYTNYTYGAGSSKLDPGYVGLVNQAMTCYLNSLLQTLYMTPEFRNALYRWEFKGNKEEGYKNIPHQLQKLFLLLQTTDRSAVETTRLTRSFGWDSSEAWQQHDIQELCRVMFEALEQSFANTDQANLIDTLYQGKMKDYVKCLACDKENARMDSFLDIPLPIRPFGTSSAYKSLEEALKAFVTPELLDDNNQYQCSNCNGMRDAHKGLKFTRYPYLLTIHLKRFDFDYQTFHRIKLNDKVTFPNILNLSEFLDDKDAMCSSSKSDSAGSAVDDAATDDSGSALDNEDIYYTPSHNTTQDEDEGIDLSTSDTEKSTNVEKKTPKKCTKDENAKDGASASDTAASESNTGITSSDKGACAIETVTATSSINKESTINNATKETNENKIAEPETVYTRYQLFSIMIHSGSASGGHYYAYIKDFTTNDWFCYNDQSVTKISDDDIRRTYGSGTRSSGGWTASANAYMLMYRQCNEQMNVLPFTRLNFPEHIKTLCKSLNEEEEQEKEARERERCTCVIKIYCHHPAATHLSDKLRVHKDATLTEATRQAHQELELYKSVPIERCRLVKYEEYNESLESSFEGFEDKPMSEVLGGVKSTYKFDLLMEVREGNQKFEVYRPGGMIIKVYTVSLADCGEVAGPFIVRGSITMTLGELKQTIGRSLTLNSDTMRIVVEGFYNEMKILGDDSASLKTEGFFRSNKVFVEATGVESNTFFIGSQMSSVIDRYQNTITLYCNLPEVTPAILADLNIPPYVEEVLTPPQLLPDRNKESPTLRASSDEGVSITDNADTPNVSSSTTATTVASDQQTASTNDTTHTELLSSSAKDPSAADPISTVIPPSLVTVPSIIGTDTSSITNQKHQLTLPVPSSSIANSPLSSSSLLSTPSLVQPGESVATGASQSNSNDNSTASSTGVSPSIASTVSSDTNCGATTTTTNGGVTTSAGNLSDGDDDDAGYACGGGYSTFSSDQSTSEDSSLTSDSDRTLVGDPPEEDRLSDRCQSPDYHNVSSPEEGGGVSAPKTAEDWTASTTAVSDDVMGDLGSDMWGSRSGEEAPVKRYFKANVLTGSDKPDERVVEMRVDKRMTVDHLKQEMQTLVGVSVDHFKLYKKYISQEFECSRGGEQLKGFGDGGRLVAKLDRALLQGEFRGKLFLLDQTNATEPARFLIDWVLREDDTVGNAKAALVKEVNNCCQLNLDVDKVRLRKKSWKNPQTVYLDHYVFGANITLFKNWELFLQERDPPEMRTDNDDEILLFVKRWRPSQLSFDAIVEVLLPQQTAEDLRVKLSEISGIPVERLEFAKGRSTFPCDLSVLEVSTELDWTWRDGPLDARPLGILDDGAVVYYRDKDEKIKEISDSERSELEADENRRLNRELPYSSTPVVAVIKPVKEKGLKIYTHNAGDTANK